MDNNEKRSNKRKYFDVLIPFELSFAKEGVSGNTREFGRGIDISSGGLGLCTKFDLKKGWILRLYLPVDKGGADLPVFSQVVWVNPVGDQVKAGLRFL
jgi:hypothetical protein